MADTISIRKSLRICGLLKPPSTVQKGLPNIKLPDEQYAYGIKRFDRSNKGRIHTEDFDQVFGLYPSDKYQRVNLTSIVSNLIGSQLLN